MLDYLNKVNEVQLAMQKQGLCYKIADICRLAASMPAPRFYIDTQTAFKQYNLYKAGRSSIHGVYKRMMYAEIFARYEQSVELLKSSGQHIGKQKIMEQILSQSAPSFYYDDDTALKMYYYIMANKKRIKRCCISF